MQRGTHQRENLDGAGCPLVAVAIDENSLSAFRWALDNIVARGQTLIVIHVNTKSSLDSTADNALREIFIPYQCFCSRKNVHCKGFVLEDPDVSKAIAEFVLQSSIEKLMIGESPKGEFDRSTDLSSRISKAVPDFCTVFVISKGKVSSARSAVRSAPPALRQQSPIQAAPKPEIPNNIPRNVMKVPNETALAPWNLHKETELIKSPFTRGGNISSTRSYENVQSNSQTIMNEEVEGRIRQSKLELKQTMNMYNSACKEAITAKQKADEQRMREAQVAEKVALALVETEGGNISSTRSYGEVMLESDISFLNNGRLNFECTYPSRLSNVSDVINYNFKSPRKSVGAHSWSGNGYSSISYKTAPCNSQAIMDGEVGEEIRRLKLELKQTMGMYY
ncbi:U-box domain-containing protein 51-like [Zingiber officinale]|uniref:U-box domain-containing protein 51-like n=1 Tax=Zingiber officinale TaxID=94328 RepID=UPI001C4B1F7D|nr:U-box domain-containing protein 51-like [Zingiber officinale]